MLLAFARRFLIRGVFAGAVLGGTGEVPLVDLRGQLPTTGEYPHREMSKVDAIVIHHSATKGQTIRSIAEFHTATRGWPAIAYHYGIGWDGKVYQFNDVDRRTNHAQGFNTRSIGVCLIGNYQDRPVPPEVVAACERLITSLRSVHTPLLKVYFHRDTKATECPGNFAAQALKELKDAPVVE